MSEMAFSPSHHVHGSDGQEGPIAMEEIIVKEGCYCKEFTLQEKTLGVEQSTLTFAASRRPCLLDGRYPQRRLFLSPLCDTTIMTLEICLNAVLVWALPRPRSFSVCLPASLQKTT